jgi:hypothetical protein
MNHHMFRTMVGGGIAAAASLTFAVVTSPAPTVAATSIDVSAATLAPAPQGIIMSDGRVCNPRWGC